MFRIGSALFIPGYVTVVFYRVFASSSEDGNGLLMALLALSTYVQHIYVLRLLGSKKLS